MSKIFTFLKTYWLTLLLAGGLVVWMTFLTFLLYRQHVPAPAPHPAEPISLPAKVSFPADSVFPLDAKLGVKGTVHWHVDSGLEGVSEGNTFHLVGLKPGTYKVHAWVLGKDGKASHLATCKVTVTNGPVPPDPPGPVDPFSKSLQAAYTQETDPAKATQAQELAQLYAQAAQTTVDDGKLTTFGALYKTLADASASLGLKDKLVSVRTLIAQELKSKLPTKTDAPLDSAGRDLARGEFQKVAAALETLK